MRLGAYIQVPFCQTKCTYCNFPTSVVSRDRYGPYVEALCREIAAAAMPQNGLVDTVYLGGGTPSLLDPGALKRILGSLQRVCGQDFIEVTLEADPETITGEKVDAWIAAGFNRVSLGAQSFNDRELRACGRMHRRADIFGAMRLLRNGGFSNISMDLIAGLPHQTLAAWHDSLAELLDLRPEHISVYVLEVDDGSRLGKESLTGGTRYSADAIPNDEAMARCYETACAQLAAAGYEHYEISNWALPGRRSRHNLKYWRREPYRGFGAGAHSFDGTTRWSNIRDAAEYVACIEQESSVREQEDAVTLEQALDEEFFLGLRQLEGVDLVAIAREYGMALPEKIASLQERVLELRSQGLVDLEGSQLRLCSNRLLVSNEIFVELLS
jgi:putative oxygen-independent coproporphyrinogen III oxidase